MTMIRTVHVLLLGLALVLLLAGGCLCGSQQDLDLLARARLSSLSGEDDTPVPVEYGTSGQSGEKSVARAMLLSALVPGLGEMYADGKRGYISGAVLAVTDVVSIWQYFDNNGKGDDKKSEYEAFARTYYSRARFAEYVRDTIVVYSGSTLFGFCEPGPTYDEEECQRQIDELFPLSSEDDGTFYEQIDLDERYVMGWVDWDPYTNENHEDFWVDWNPYEDLPDGIPTSSPRKDEYRKIRDEADDFYGKADRYAWIMVIGRVVSMVDAAIMVKLKNRDLAGIGTNPRLTFKAKLGGSPSVKLGLKMRF
jgi:hypothetical protein